MRRRCERDESALRPVAPTARRALARARMASTSVPSRRFDPPRRASRRRGGGPRPPEAGARTGPPEGRRGARCTARRRRGETRVLADRFASLAMGGEVGRSPATREGFARHGVSAEGRRRVRRTARGGCSDAPWPRASRNTASAVHGVGFARAARNVRRRGPRRSLRGATVLVKVGTMVANTSALVEAASKTASKAKVCASRRREVDGSSSAHARPGTSRPRTRRAAQGLTRHTTRVLRSSGAGMRRGGLASSRACRRSGRGEEDEPVPRPRNMLYVGRAAYATTS